MEKISKLNLDLENLLKNRLSHRDTSEVSLDLTDNWWHINKSLLSGTNLLHSPSQHEEISEFTQFVQSVLKKSVGSGDQTHLKDIFQANCANMHIHVVANFYTEILLSTRYFIQKKHLAKSEVL